MRFPIIAKTVEQLNAIGKPNGALSEAIPYVIYDTQTYAAAGVAGQLQFFLTQQADQTLGNLQTAGLLPQPQWFEIHGIYCDFQGVPIIRAAGAAATAVGGQLDDIEQVLKLARATWELNIAQKSYGVLPLTFLHASGGGIGFYAGLFTAATAVNQGNNGIQGSSWAPNGSIVIPPTQGFSVTLRFQPTLVPISVATLIRISMAGVLHRAVR
jgi:hypothetical protein